MEHAQADTHTHTRLVRTSRTTKGSKRLTEVLSDTASGFSFTSGLCVSTNLAIKCRIFFTGRCFVGSGDRA